MCKPCENFGLYETTLERVLKLLLDALSPQRSPDDAEKEAIEGIEDPLFHDANLIKLIEMSEMDRRVNKVKHLLCKKAFEDQKMPCLKSECQHRGFAPCWSRGLRKQLVSENGKLKPGEHPVGHKTVNWSRYKIAKGDIY